MIRNDAPLRDRRENMLGVCAAIGKTSGIDPLWIRLGFVAAILIVSLKLTVLAYCIAAVAVKVARR